jgi:hypothetical protein
MSRGITVLMLLKLVDKSLRDNHGRTFLFEEFESRLVELEDIYEDLLKDFLHMWQILVLELAGVQLEKRQAFSEVFVYIKQAFECIYIVY